MIRQDIISGILFIYSLGAITWLATFSTTTVVTFPALLLIMGYVGELRFSKKLQEPSETDDPRRVPWVQVGVYSGIALAAILATGYFVSYINLSELATLPPLNGVLYTTSIAVAEEFFFRGFILDLLLTTHIPMVGAFSFLSTMLNSAYVKIAFSSFIFMGYHWYRYGTSVELLVYVLVGGFALGWANYASKRLSPSCVAHLMNNLLAMFGV